MRIRRRWIAVSLSVFGMAGLAPATSLASDACPGDEVVPTTATVAQAATALVCDLNQIRAAHGLPALSWSWHLWYAGQMMATDMAAKHYVSHEMPDGRTVADRVIPTGYSGGSDDWLLLENVGWTRGVLSSPAAMTAGWMNSEGHRVNILDPDVRDIGIGLVEG